MKIEIKQLIIISPRQKVTPCLKIHFIIIVIGIPKRCTLGVEHGYKLLTSFVQDTAFVVSIWF